MAGIDLMKNFNQPYFSTNITEFWRRWHISLSTWLKDYLYIPLGVIGVADIRRILIYGNYGLRWFMAWSKLEFCSLGFSSWFIFNVAQDVFRAI